MVIVDQDFIPEPSSLAYKNQSNDYQYRCSFEQLTSRGVAKLIQQHRGIILCNSAGLDGENLDLAFANFKLKVNEDYSHWYQGRIQHFAMYAVSAFLAWLAIVAATILAKWILRREP